MGTLKCDTHAGRYRKRSIFASVLTVIYLLISLSPLASPALYSQPGTHAPASECTGDCRIDGCTTESRVNKTCCCAKKALQHSSLQHKDDVTSTPDCCKKESSTHKTAILSCGCPGKDGQHVTLSAGDSSEQIPFHFTELCSIPHIATTFTNFKDHLTSRHDDPPDPPPKLS